MDRLVRVPRDVLAGSVMSVLAYEEVVRLYSVSRVMRARVLEYLKHVALRLMSGTQMSCRLRTGPRGTGCALRCLTDHAR